VILLSLPPSSWDYRHGKNYFKLKAKKKNFYESKAEEIMDYPVNAGGTINQAFGELHNFIIYYICFAYKSIIHSIYQN
jgi:hypothetical protein